MTDQELEDAIDAVILDSGMPPSHVVLVLEAMLDRYKEEADD